MSVAIDLYEQAFLEGLRPDPDLTVSEWADMYRVLTTETSAEAGPWRTSRTPYLREIMDRLSPSDPVQVVTVMKGSQLGLTEGGNNWLGFVIDYSPGPMLYVMPTVETARRASKSRIKHLLEGTPRLRGKVREPRSRDSGNTTFMKEFPGGSLILTGANSAVGLRSQPIRYLFLDEIDGYPASAGDEGDPVALAIQRTKTFSSNRKIFQISTPTLKDFSRIEKAFMEGDQRYYFVPCPNCKEHQVLKWGVMDHQDAVIGIVGRERVLRPIDERMGGVTWPEGHPELAYYLCPFCGYHIQNHEKTWMLNNGEWRATAECDPRNTSYHLPSYYSPVGWESLNDIAVEFKDVHKDPPRFQVFVNTKFAETWEETASKIDEKGLIGGREEWGERVPKGVAVMTAGSDIHPDRIELELVGWGRDEESWSLDYKIMWGDTSATQVWEDLDQYLLGKWEHALGGSLPILAACLDTGDQTLKVYDFCRPRQGRHVWAIKGKGGQGLPLWPRRPSKRNKGKIPLFLVGVDTAKEALYARLQNTERSGPGVCHFPKSRDPEYFRQLTAERVLTRYHLGRPIRTWTKPDSVRNEALDCRVYAMAALQGLISMGLQLNRRVDEMEGTVGDANITRPAIKKPSPENDWLERGGGRGREGGWL